MIQGIYSRTITFVLNVTGGTNPSYLIDFNDGSAINFPKSAALNTTYNFTHTFPDNGYYKVNITVFNLVSINSAIIPVRLKFY
jgi:PKD repeat protein